MLVSNQSREFAVVKLITNDRIRASMEARINSLAYDATYAWKPSCECEREVTSMLYIAVKDAWEHASKLPGVNHARKQDLMLAAMIQFMQHRNNEGLQP
jgi:hypothetical protein